MKRKIQLIAGTTYSITLPKEWIKKNNLKEKNELNLQETNNGTIILSPEVLKETGINEIVLDIKDYLENIDQVLFALYYLGIEKIEIFSKENIPKEIKIKIRKTFSHMSGSEISYEDEKKIILRILIDKTKINLKQVIHRIILVLDLSMQNILEELDKREIRINEDEIDRLYHLAAKTITLSLVDYKVLHSSEIHNILLIPSYFLVCKKLENIGDNINHLSTHMLSKKTNVRPYKEYVQFFRQELSRVIKHILNNYPNIFTKVSDKERKIIKDKIFQIDDKIISDYLKEILRYIRDIEDELIQISYNQKLIEEKKI